MRARGLEGWITPLPRTAITAARFLWHRGIRANLVDLDASREEADMLADLEAYRPLLRPGGLLVGDDGIAAFPGVARACAAFARRHGLVSELHGVNFVLREPAAARDGETPPAVAAA